MSSSSNIYNIIIGAGHAGIEAATASARMKIPTLLITKSKENLGEMSCNPAIGGVAKGTIVREIDALDGIMGKAIDMSGIHFRILNSSKGPAVHSPRAQADRKLYKKAINQLLENYQNLSIIFGFSNFVEEGEGEGTTSSTTARSSRNLSHNSGASTGSHNTEAVTPFAL